MDNYLQRMGPRTGNAPWNALSEPDTQPYPFQASAAKRMLPLADQRIGMLSYWLNHALSRRCNRASVKRNSKPRSSDCPGSSGWRPMAN